eukprot:7079128-Prymnesium_polylepis.2
MDGAWWLHAPTMAVRLAWNSPMIAFSMPSRWIQPSPPEAVGTRGNETERLCSDTSCLHDETCCSLHIGGRCGGRTGRSNGSTWFTVRFSIR